MQRYFLINFKFYQKNLNSFAMNLVFRENINLILHLLAHLFLQIKSTIYFMDITHTVVWGILKIRSVNYNKHFLFCRVKTLANFLPKSVAFWLNISVAMWQESNLTFFKNTKTLVTNRFQSMPRYKYPNVSFGFVTRAWLGNSNLCCGRYSDDLLSRFA